jgi:hypothetical protein
MFTTIMYGFINEVTRQPGNADLTLTRRKRPSMTSARRRIRRAAGKSTPLPRQYGVLADSFKRAAGFH